MCSPRWLQGTILKLNPGLSPVIKFFIFPPKDQEPTEKEQTMQGWQYEASPDRETLIGTTLSKERLSIGVISTLCPWM